MREITAKIRNKLQCAKRALETLSKGESVSKRMAEPALVDLERIVKILEKLEGAPGKYD